MPKTPEYIKGARFIHEDEEIEQALWPRHPGEYTPSDKFFERRRRLAGIIEGEDITHAIMYGEMWPAANGCIAFVTDMGGVVLYVVVQSEMIEDQWTLEQAHEEEKDFGPGDLNYRLVTIWPYVHDRDRAWATGRWTGQQLDVIEEIEPDIHYE